jgi:hypothetical protein
MNVRTLCFSLLAITCLLPRSAFAAVPPAASITMAVSNGSGFAVSWNSVSTATYYYLWITDSGGVVRHQIWYTAANVGCNTGQSTCQRVLNLPLQPGTTHIWVQTWNTDGYGPWSAEYRTLAQYGQLRSYDATGKFIGTFVDENRVILDYNGTPTVFPVDFTGFRRTGQVLFYSSAACSSPGHTEATYPHRADVVGTYAFIRTGTVVQNFDYLATRAYTPEGAIMPCMVGGGTLPAAQLVTAVPLDTIFGTVTAPFTLVR